MPTIAPLLAEVAGLVGDRARANILSALMRGQPLTALDLAAAARVTPQTTSSHLAKLLSGELVSVQKRGRNRYYSLATPHVAQMLENIMVVAASGPQRHRPRSRLDYEMRLARTCYDHLAGKLGVAISDGLIGNRYVVLDEHSGEVTEAGRKFLNFIDIEPKDAPSSRRMLCRPCLDWSERSPHLAGSVGALLAQRCFERGWIRRRSHNRSVEITISGSLAFSDLFGVRLAEEGFSDRA